MTDADKLAAAMALIRQLRDVISTMIRLADEDGTWTAEQMQEALFQIRQEAVAAVEDLWPPGS